MTKNHIILVQQLTRLSHCHSAVVVFTSSKTILKSSSSWMDVYELSNWQNIIRCEAMIGLNSWTTTFESISSLSSCWNFKFYLSNNFGFNWKGKKHWNRTASFGINSCFFANSHNFPLNLSFNCVNIMSFCWSNTNNPSILDLGLKLEEKKWLNAKFQCGFIVHFGFTQNEWMKFGWQFALCTTAVCTCVSMFMSAHIQYQTPVTYRKTRSSTICAHKYQHNIEFHGVAQLFFHFNHLQPNELMKFCTFFFGRIQNTSINSCNNR